MLSEFVQSFDLGSFRLHSPAPFVLLCGGAVVDIHTPPSSLRDHFLRKSIQNSKIKSELVQIEEINDYYNKNSPYNNFLEFERDIAQLSDLVVIFSESPGSFTELGSFSSFPEIQEKTLVVIQAKHANGPGFIARGPVALLRSRFPQSVYTIVDSEFGIAGSNFASINADLLHDRLIEPIHSRLGQARERTTPNLARFNHKAKLFIALLQEFTVLRNDEILLFFKSIGHPISEDLLRAM